MAFGRLVTGLEWIYAEKGSNAAWIAIMAAGAATIAASCVLMVRDKADYPNLYQD